jgi:hypothetical protein
MQSNPITSQRPAHASVIWTTALGQACQSLILFDVSNIDRRLRKTMLVPSQH